MKLLSIIISFPLVLILSGCSDMCSNQILQEVPAPDNKLEVVVFQRDCGATTGFSTQVSVVKSGEKLQNTSGDVFIADTDHGKAPSGPGGGPTVDVVWKKPNLLQIAHHQNARIFLAAKQLKVSTGIFSSEAVQITYSSAK